MSGNAGQSLTPYPWPERKKFNDSRRMISPVVRFTRVLMYFATVMSLPSVVFWLWARFGYRRNNDWWAKRGLITLAIGALSIAFFTPGPMDILSAWNDLLRSFGPRSKLDVRECAVAVVLVALPYAIVLQGLHSLARSFQIERTTNAFLKPQRATLGARIKRQRNISQLRRGVTSRHGGGYARFGVIEDDRIPWRASRYGMVVERKIERMGHGVFLGSNGAGKTRAAETFSHYLLSDDCAVIYIDFKASLSAMRGLAAVARANGKPCYTLDIGFGTSDTSWYDLFAWAGTPSDKASVLIECLQFPEGQGGVAHYRGIAEAWLPMQIEAAELVGLRDGEGMFDFLLETSVPTRFRDRIEPLRQSSDPKVRAKFEQWHADSALRKAPDLEGLRSELTKIVNAAGHRLKPNAHNPDPVSMKEVMDNGGLVYIGIASGINDVVVKVLGSFLFRELSILVSARSRVPDTDRLRDVFVIPDEASEMEERSVMLNPLYTMAREARIFLWPSFQSFAVWDESTQKEIASNTRNFLAFSIPERETAARVAETIPDIFALKQMSEEQTRQQAFQEQTVGISGDARLEVVTDSFLRPHIELSQIPIYHAYIWFKDGEGVSRDRWWSRRRVKKDLIKGDAPLVKLIPYDLVMPDSDDDSMEVHDTPETVQSIVLPDGNHFRSPAESAAAVRGSSRPDASEEEWGADPTPADFPERFAADDDVPPEDAEGDRHDEGAPPARWSTSGISRGEISHAHELSGGEPLASGASSKAVAASGPGTIPAPVEADDFTEDGAEGGELLADGPACEGRGARSALREGGTTVWGPGPAPSRSEGLPEGTLRGPRVPDGSAEARARAGDEEEEVGGSARLRDDSVKGMAAGEDSWFV